MRWVSAERWASASTCSTAQLTQSRSGDHSPTDWAGLGMPRAWAPTSGLPVRVSTCTRPSVPSCETAADLLFPVCNRRGDGLRPSHTSEMRERDIGWQPVLEDRQCERGGRSASACWPASSPAGWWAPLGSAVRLGAETEPPAFVDPPLPRGGRWAPRRGRLAERSPHDLDLPGVVVADTAERAARGDPRGPCRVRGAAAHQQAALPGDPADALLVADRQHADDPRRHDRRRPEHRGRDDRGVGSRRWWATT